jgi:glutaminase
VFADGCIGYTNFFANVGANPKHLPFNKVLELVHNAKLEK